MPIETTLKKIVECQGALSTFVAKQWPAAQTKTSYALGKLFRQVVDELKQYEEARLKLLKEYGEEIEPDVWQVRQNRADINALNEAVSSLLDAQVSLFGQLLTVEQIEDAKLPMSPVEWAMLDFLIKE